MPFEDTVIRQALARRSRRARDRGGAQEPGLQVRQAADVESFDLRGNALFVDISAMDLIGFAIIGTMQT